MLVTLSGITTLVSDEQPLNAERPMLVPPVITTDFNDDGTYDELSLYDEAPNIYPKCVSLVPSFVAPTNGIVILSRLSQPLNASSPMLVS